MYKCTVLFNHSDVNAKHKNALSYTPVTKCLTRTNKLQCGAKSVAVLPYQGYALKSFAQSHIVSKQRKKKQFQYHDKNR